MTASGAVKQVLARIQMRKQACVLKHIANLPLVRGQKCAGCRVLPRRAAKRDATRQSLKTGHASQNSCLATSGGAKQRRYARCRRGECRIQLKAPETAGERYLDQCR